MYNILVLNLELSECGGSGMLKEELTINNLAPLTAWQTFYQLMLYNSSPSASGSDGCSTTDITMHPRIANQTINHFTNQISIKACQH